MARLERVFQALLIALVVWLPFEFRSFPMLSNLQWLFIAVAAAGLPIVIFERKRLLHDRLVVAALVFVLIQWIAAYGAEEFTANAAKGAIRVSAGLFLLCATLCLRHHRTLLQVWCVSAAVAAVYGVIDYNGFGVPYAFREAEFYVSDVLRLSGSFEYPNTAAAYFAISLPIVWLTPGTRYLRVLVSIMVWLALILTYSRGAVTAAILVLLIWGAAGRTRAAVELAGAGIGVYVVLSLFQPFLIHRLHQFQFERALDAEYRPEFNLLRYRPEARGELQIHLKNVGAATWLPDGDQPVTIGYHWYDTKRKEIAPLAPIHTPIPKPVRRNESLSIQASFQTPKEPGLYLMSWDLAQRGRGWFSANGVVPSVVEVDIQPDIEAWYGNGDVSRRVRPETPRRTALWKAASALTLQNPILGAGPDNFRLLYGKPLGFSRWDTKIRSNSLYFELLVGSGLAGLAAFAYMMACIGRNAGAAMISLGIFLVHGLVDVFLMATPIYFGFWILMGLAHENRV